MKNWVGVFWGVLLFLYSNDIKNRELDQSAPQNFYPIEVTIHEEQGVHVGDNSEKVPPQLNGNSSTHSVLETEENSVASQHNFLDESKNEGGGSDFGLQACTITAKYMQGSGIGYKQSYTTLEAFLAPPRCFNEWNPYLDLRGHVFNDGYLAANGGFGLRYVSSIAWGANVYYDYRNTGELHYNQIGAGFEVIGPFWSLNINGYLPFGKKKTPFFNPSITGTGLPSMEFAFFQGNQIFLQLSGTEALIAKKEFAFKGINATAAFRLITKKNLSIDFSAGPYYFDGYYKKYAVGGQGTASFRIGDIFSLSLIGSYDNLFHGRIQGSAAFSIPLGPKSFRKKCSYPSVGLPSFYNYHLARGPERSEIIVVDQDEKVLASATDGAVTVAINPSTGEPYQVWFVDNTSSSAGTYESPYPTLAEAQAASGPNDIIYVFPGDGTDMGMDAGIVLQDNQQLLGSEAAVSLSTTIGTIVIPPLSVGIPLVSNAGGAVVTLANGNVVSGIHIGTSATGVDGSSIGDLQILSCQMDASALPVSLNNVTGSITISNNSLSEYTDQGVRFISTAGASNLSVSGNTFTAMAGAPNTYGITTNSSGASELTLSVSNNVFSGHTISSIGLSSSGSSVLNPTISGNTITAPVGAPNTTAIQLNPGGISSATSVTGNTLINHEGNSLNATADSAVAFSIVALNNTIQGISGTSAKGIAIDTTGVCTSSWAATIQNNTLSGGFTQADIYLDPRGSSALSAVITGNTVFGDGSFSPNGIQIDADDTSTVSSAVINSNVSKNHTAAEISLSSRGIATSSTSTISNNEITGQVAGGSGIQISSSSGGVLATTISNNVIIDVHQNGIGLFSNNTSSLTATLSSNQISAPAAIANTTGINCGSADTSSLFFTANNNTLQNHTSLSISGSFNGSAGAATLSGNTLVGIAGTSAKAISLNSGNTSSLMWLVDIQNNTCSGGFTQADIYVNPQGTSTLTSAIIAGNSTIGAGDGSSPYGIQLDADDGSVVTSLIINNNSSKNHTSAEVSVTARGMSNPSITTTVSNNQLTSDALTTQSLIFLNTFNNGTLTATVSGNSCIGTSTNAIQAQSSNTAILETTITNNNCSNYTTNGISVSCSNTVAATSTISNNTVTGNSTGIVVNLSDSCTMDTTIANNTLAHHEAQSINVNFGASDLICKIENNDVSIGSLTGNAFGILVNAGGVTQTIEISGNNVDTETGGIGSQFGIVIPQQSSSGSLKSATINNNVVTNCGNAPAVGIPLTSGIVFALISTDDFFANCQANTTVNCGIGPDGQGGIIGARLDIGAGIPGHFCWALHNCNSDSGFTLVNNPPTGMASDFTLDASGNTGSITPYMGSPFSVGTCP